MRALAFLAVLILAPLTDAIAQEHPLPLERGHRVRVTAPQSRLDETEATLIASRQDTLVVRWRRTQLVRGEVVRDSVTSAVPLLHITKFEVGQRQSNWKKGLMWGSAIGCGMGLVLMVASEADEDSYVVSCSGAQCVLTGIFGGALWGLAIGALIKTDKWEEVQLDRLRVSIAPTRNGFGLGARISF